MKNGEKTLLCLVGCLLLGGQATTAPAVSAENPYTAITSRNVFGLKPPPPPPPDPASIKPPPPRLFLTGITTIFGNKRALLKGTFPMKPGDPAKEQSFILSEGQRDGDIEVITIDEKNAVVTVNDFGTVTNLTFEKNGATAAAAGGAPAPVGFTPQPAPAPAGRVLPMPTIPRPVRVPTTAAPAPESPAATSDASPNPIPINPSIQNYANSEYVRAVPEEQVIMMEVAREQHKDDPEFPPFPPTQLTPGYDPETGTIAPPQQSQGTPNQQSPVSTPGFPRLPGRPNFPPSGF